MLNYCANGPAGYNLTRSLRFRSSASASLSRTFGTPTSGTTWTMSFWFKRGALGVGQELFAKGNTSTQPWTFFYIDANGALNYYEYNTSNGNNVNINTTPLYRDPSSWYHIMVVVDSTQATASNRIKFYVNGSQVTALGTASTIGQNTSTVWNSSGGTSYIGRQGGGDYLDGYLTEVNFIDGQALTPSFFGSTNSTTGVWQPAKYTGTYGTNGFYLPFTDNSALTTSSNAGLGKDFSGNSNYWVTNNISITSGTTYDSMTDVPTLTSATVANFATLNPLVKSNTALSSANLNITTSGGAGSNQWTLDNATIFASSGKWYVEFYIVNKTADAGGSSIGIGLQSSQAASTYTSGQYLGQQTTGEYNYQAHGYTYFNNVQSGTPVWASYTTGDTIGVAYDLDSLICYWYKNNVLQGSTSLISGYSYAPATSVYQASINSFNAGQRPFSYTPPTGFVALNTYNLPTSTIVKGNTVMDATTFTGNGTGQSIVNAAGFKPDFVWWKDRTDNGIWHMLSDSIRGTGNTLSSNVTDAQYTGYTSLTAFNSNGFTLGNDPATGYFGWNLNGKAYVGWQWQAGQGSTSSNTSGSITSTVSVNATAGFSVVTFTAPASGNWTIGHGLGVAPSFVITKSRSAGGWIIYHSSLGNTKWLEFTTGAAQTGTSFPFNSLSPTSTVINYGNSTSWGASSTFVAYCWAEIAGFSKFGSYTGNGSTDGTFVYTGFRPKYVMIKVTSTTEDWYIWDTSRGTYNANTPILYADLSAAESTSAIDTLSNGFKCRTAQTLQNANGATYIYMAFAENPFKNALAR